MLTADNDFNNIIKRIGDDIHGNIVNAIIMCVIICWSPMKIII